MCVAGLYVTVSSIKTLLVAQQCFDGMCYVASNNTTYKYLNYSLLFATLKADGIFWTTLVDITWIFSSQWKRKKKKATIHFWTFTSTGYRIVLSVWNPSVPRSEAHPCQSLSAPGITSPPCKQTISPGFLDTQSQSSLWLTLTQELEFLTTFQGKWIKPSAGTVSL